MIRELIHCWPGMNEHLIKYHNILNQETRLCLPVFVQTRSVNKRNSTGRLAESEEVVTRIKGMTKAQPILVSFSQYWSGKSNKIFLKISENE
jgi:hypothetical protein